MNFKIDGNNIIELIPSYEEIPLSALLINFINYPMSKFNKTKSKKNISHMESILYELIDGFLDKKVEENTPIIIKDKKDKDGREDMLENPYHLKELFTIVYSNSKTILINLQKVIIKLTESAFIEKIPDLNFVGFNATIKTDMILISSNKQFYELIEIDDIATFCLFAIFKLYNSGATINKCQNCGKYFVPVSRKDEIYCNNIISNGRTCKQIGYENKIKKNEIIKEYRKAYKSRNALKQRTKSSNSNAEKEFKNWVYEAKTKLGECQDGNLPLDEFFKWLSKK